MKNASKLTVLGLILTTGATLCAPMMASADGLQNSKNLWRNIATGAAVLAGVGIATHNNTDTAIGAVGAVVGLSQYENARHEQSVQQNGCNGPGYFDNGQQACAGQNVNIGLTIGPDGRYYNHDGSPYGPRHAYNIDRNVVRNNFDSGSQGRFAVDQRPQGRVQDNSRFNN